MILHQERGNCPYFNICCCAIFSTTESSSASLEPSSSGCPRCASDHRQYGVELKDSEGTTAEQSPPEADKQPYAIIFPLE